MRSLNPDHLHTFSVVATAGSFSAAARRLNLTQPAVSLQVGQLEQRLNVRLIERSGRGLRLTAAGERLLVEARRIETAVEDALAAMAPYHGDAAGRVAIGTGATACIYLLPRILEELRRALPKVQIVVQTGNTGDILRKLDDNAIDIALVTGPVRGRMFETVASIADEQVAVFPRRGLAPPKSVTAKSAGGLPLLLYEPGGNTRRLIDDWFRRGGAEPEPVMELGSVEAIKELINAGLGCGILPRMAVAGDRGRFVVRSLAPALRRTLFVVLRRDKVLYGGLRHLIRIMKSRGIS